ncbi:hypothetical protein [Actinomadura miaoliensis]|uniref:hypothetical protein n=1 Tax=Actinomadura miaoliensis TaxID=430685 RepID=UPI0031F14FA0
MLPILFPLHVRSSFGDALCAVGEQLHRILSHRHTKRGLVARSVVADLQVERVVESALQIFWQIRQLQGKLGDEVEEICVVPGGWCVGVELVEFGLLGAPRGGELGEASLDGLPVVAVGLGIPGGLEGLQLANEVVLAALQVGQLTCDLLATFGVRRVCALGP